MRCHHESNPPNELELELEESNQLTDDALQPLSLELPPVLLEANTPLGRARLTAVRTITSTAAPSGKGARGSRWKLAAPRGSSRELLLSRVVKSATALREVDSPA